MNVGDKVYWTDGNGIQRICEIQFIDYDFTGDEKYTILLPERNVMLESIETSNNTGYDNIRKGDTILYVKMGTKNEALVTKIDYNSNSAQIRLIIKDLILAY